MNTRVPTTLALLTLVLATACGVQSEQDPRTLAADEVPYGLLDRGPALPPPTSTPAVANVNVAVYFLVNERVQPAPRAVTDPATVARAVAALLDGPTEEEAVAGLRTAINPSTQATVTRVSPDVVVVDLTPDFAAVPTQEQRLAIAQIVFTATGAGASRVRFTIGGSPVGVPLPDGTVTLEPVNRDAFASLAPPPPPGPNDPA